MVERSDQPGYCFNSLDGKSSRTSTKTVTVKESRCRRNLYKTVGFGGEEEIGDNHSFYSG